MDILFLAGGAALWGVMLLLAYLVYALICAEEF